MKNNSVHLKAGSWYMIANFVNKGVAMLIMPFLTRMMSTTDYGNFSNFSAWATMIATVTSLDMANVIVRSKFDYEDDFDSFMSTVVITTFLSTTVFCSIIMVFRSFFLRLFGFDDEYIYALIIFLYFHPSISYYTAKQVAWLKYKSSAVVSLSSSVLILVLSILLVDLMPDKLMARTVSYVGIPAVYGIIIYGCILKRNIKYDIEKVKNTLKLSVPLIPHNLANGILGSSDRVFIKRYWAADHVAYYSVGYNIGNILYLFTQSVGQAYTPWLFEKLKAGEYKQALIVSNYLSTLAFILSCFFVGLAPEAVLILGGTRYNPSTPIIPIVTVGIFFQFISKLYINIEQYIKRTYMISMASVTAATVNVGLNILLVPKHGYIAAAWTTLISYGVALLMHLLLVCRTQYTYAINSYYQIMLGTISLSLIPLSSLLYAYTIIRIIFVLIMIGIALYIMRIVLNKLKVS